LTYDGSFVLGDLNMTISPHSLLTRTAVIEHEKKRCVGLGNHLSFLFEDETTIRYRLQEMLHIEKIFDEAGIAAELEAYLPLVPDGGNLKATCRSRMKRNETARRISVNAVDRR
jgi:hypothetical protein